MKISIIGAGNGGQAMAAHFSQLGHDIVLYNRNLKEIEEIVYDNKIELYGELNFCARIKEITDDLQYAIESADIIMITTTADAHREIGEKAAKYIKNNQIIVLNPGRTLGALEFWNCVKSKSSNKFYIAEAQSLIYACRKESGAKVKIIGVKDKVLLSAFPASDTDFVFNKLNSIFPCFVKAENILETGLENIGAILHPTVVLFNAASIERGSDFYFYNDMTPSIAEFIEKLDKERMAIGKCFGLKIKSVSEWISYAYSNILGNSLCEKMRNNKAYFQIKAPTTLDSRLLTEDIPTGILPMIELGQICGLKLPLMQSLLILSSTLLNRDFVTEGRTLKNLNISDLSKEDLLSLINK